MGMCLGREGHLGADEQQGPCRRRPGGVSSRLDAEQATLGSRRRDLTVVGKAESKKAGIRDPWVHMWAIDPTAPSEGLVSQLGPRAHWKRHCTTHTTPDGTPPIHSSSRHALQPLARPPFAPDHTSRPSSTHAAAVVVVPPAFPPSPTQRRQQPDPLLCCPPRRRTTPPFRTP